MKRFRDWLGASAARLFVFYTVGWGVATWLVSFVDGHGETTAYSIGVRVCVALGFGGIMTALTVRRIRRNGGRALIRDMVESLDSGEVPTHADPEVWLPQARRQRRWLQRTRRLVPIGGAAFALLGVWLILDGEVVAGVVLVLLFVAFCAVNEYQARWRLKQFDELIARLSDER